MAEGENLGVERNSGAKALPDRMEERENDREHVAGKLSPGPRKFNRFNQYRVFGRDSAGSLYDCYVLTGANF